MPAAAQGNNTVHTKGEDSEKRKEGKGGGGGGGGVERVEIGIGGKIDDNL